jgi:hypothetical protein
MIMAVVGWVKVMTLTSTVAGGVSSQRKSRSSGSHCGYDHSCYSYFKERSNMYVTYTSKHVSTRSLLYSCYRLVTDYAEGSVDM